MVVQVEGETCGSRRLRTIEHLEMLYVHPYAAGQGVGDALGGCDRAAGRRSWRNRRLRSMPAIRPCRSSKARLCGGPAESASRWRPLAGQYDDEEAASVRQTAEAAAEKAGR